MKRFSGLLSNLGASLTQKQCEKSMAEVLDRKGGFGLGSQKMDWVKTCSLRLRCMHRHWLDAARRGAKWQRKYLKAPRKRQGPA